MKNFAIYKLADGCIERYGCCPDGDVDKQLQHMPEGDYGLVSAPYPVSPRSHKVVNGALVKKTQEEQDAYAQSQMNWAPSQ